MGLKALLPFYLFTLLLLTACSSDDDMTELNTDPTKAASVDASAQLTTAELQTYGDLSEVEIYRNYFYAFTQQLMGCWNTTNYGGRHTADNSEMGRIWTTFYNQGIKNLVDADVNTKNNPDEVNVNAAVRIYKVYMMSIITDTYGDCPYTEAGRGFTDGIANPKYDTQKDIYYDFFAQLDSAVSEFDASKAKIQSDVIYDGDIAQWKKLANSLRLRYAMRISDVDPDKAQQEFEKALRADGGIIESPSDDALIKYMSVAFSFGQESYSDYRRNALAMLLFGNDPANNPSYVCSTFFNQLYDSGDPRTFLICRCYWDKLMSSTSTDGRIDLTDEVRSHNLFQPNKPGAYSWEPWPSGYTSETLTTMAQTNPDVAKAGTNADRECEPKVASNFLNDANPGVVITSAEVKFLLAEATLKGWNVNRGTVEELYKEGVRESMDFLADNYNTGRVSDADFETFIKNNGIGHTAEQAKQAINTQAWILHFTNPAECWANQRRSGYPVLKSPADYGFSSNLVDGQQIPLRLRYPVLESSYNKANYDEALMRMGGNDSWYAHVWWDVER